AACADRRDDERLHRGLGCQDAAGAQAAGEAARPVAVAVLRCCTGSDEATCEDRKWPVTWSGWPDLNRRPLRPELRAHANNTPGQGHSCTSEVSQQRSSRRLTAADRT